MKVEVYDDHTTVIIVSKRNLLTLLQKVNLPAGESHCTLIRDCADGKHVVIKAEPDDIHYGDRMPGVMRQDAEDYIKRSNE